MSGRLRWNLMSESVTDVHPSPVIVRGTRSSVLGAISGGRRGHQPTEIKINQNLAALSSVTTPTSGTRSAGVLTTPTLLGATPTSTAFKDDSNLDTTRMSLMDETGEVREFQLTATPNNSVLNFSSSNVPDSSPFQGSSPFTVNLINKTVMGPGDVTLANDPVIQAGDDLLKSFHCALSDHPISGQVLELLSALSEACTQQIDLLKGVSRSNRLSDTVTELIHERDTWLIVHALYTDRLSGCGQGEDSEEMEGEGRVKTDKIIVDEHFMRNSDIREAQVVVDWLERISCTSLEDFPAKVKYFADSVSWENTIHDIQQGINKSTIVTEVDPDAPLRQNKKLSELDESDELTLCKHLFKLIRAGQLEKAKEVCERCGQSWRGATLDGWKLHHDPNLDKGIGDQLDQLEGNCGRDLWKHCCWEMANCSSYSTYERAMYAALCGHTSQLLPVCQSWYDTTWAYYRVMVDVLVEQRLRGCDRFPRERITEGMPDEYWTTPILSPGLIFQEIEASSNTTVAQQSKEMYHQVQKYIILGDLESLINTLHLCLKKYCFSIHHLRFMVHVVLFVKTVGVEYDVPKCNDILKVFTETLIDQQYHELVALYTSQLPPDQQVYCYSQLLSGVVGEEDQRNCLRLAEEAGLDVHLITKTVVQNMREASMEDLPSDVMDSTYWQEMQLTETDLKKIRVLDWLFFNDTQRLEAVRQANAMIRSFLAAKKHAAAYAVFNKIPPHTTSIIEQQVGDVPLPADTENHLLEFCGIKTYLEAVESFNNWFKCFHTQHQAPAPPTNDDYTQQLGYEGQTKRYMDQVEQHQIQLQHLAQIAEQKIYNVLLFVKGGWMIDAREGGEEDSARRKQMQFLRQLCIPYLCMLLHTVLHGSKEFKKCLRLADVIASEKHQLYQVFRGSELKQFLTLLHSSSLELLNTVDVDPFGY